VLNLERKHRKKKRESDLRVSERVCVRRETPELRQKHKNQRRGESFLYSSTSEEHVAFEH